MSARGTSVTRASPTRTGTPTATVLGTRSSSPASSTARSTSIRSPISPGGGWARSRFTSTTTATPAATLEPQLLESLDRYAEHGHLTRDATGRLRYAFIHGNWCLANARSDGRWCGVDEEVPLLFKTGCYADFTFPSAPDECQPNFVNRIYWPTGDLTAKRCYESGEEARVGHVLEDRILMVQGPVALARRPGKASVRIESSALTAGDPASEARVRSWVSQGIHVRGRPEWIFVKVHTHGAPDKEAASLLGDGGHALHRALARYNDGKEWILHYVTAREMYNIAIAAMEGRSGDPNAYRDHVFAPPPVATAGG